MSTDVTTPGEPTRPDRDADLVVLVDDAGRPIGTSPRESVHGPDTPRHLAFSLHLVDEAGRLLVTRRALGKRSWPGTWTNSCCGHPRPGEQPVDAAVRRAREELGVEVTGVRPALPGFRYRATDVSGIVENEVCPVFVGRIDGAPSPDPDEVCEFFLDDIDAILRSAIEQPRLWSPWFARQARDPALRAALDELVGTGEPR